ncbi:MAG: C4-dicarboxylate ABC transporter, partial [Oleibacter sp.]|nr:C4-dicarboxylate ABC transporter [Thalassolituus sp.]
MEHPVRVANRSPYEWLAAFPAFLVLVFVIIISTSHTIHAQLLQLGEGIWEGYFQLRNDPMEPSCNINVNIDEELARLIRESNSQEIDEFDLFAPEPVNPEAMRSSLVAAQEQCQVKFDQYMETKDRITP